MSSNLTVDLSISFALLFPKPPAGLLLPLNILNIKMPITKTITTLTYGNNVSKKLGLAGTLSIEILAKFLYAI